MAEGGWWVVTKAAGSRLVRFLPKSILNRLYPFKKMMERIRVVAFGIGPYFYVTPGRPATIEAVQLLIINLLPFPVHLESVEVSILIEGTQLARKNSAHALSVDGFSVGQLYLSHDLTDSQAVLVRAYPSASPIFRMGGQANFRTSFQQFSLPIQIEIRSIIHK